MKLIIRFLSLLSGTVLLVMLHIGISSMTSFPWSTINGIFIGCLLLLLRRETSIVIWLSFCCHFIIELYSQHVFGIALYAGTISMLGTYWLYQYVFTNKTWYAACALTASSLLSYRVLYSVGLFVASVWGNGERILWAQLFWRYGAEIIFTTALVVVVYGAFNFFFPTTDTSRYRISWYAS